MGCKYKVLNRRSNNLAAVIWAPSCRPFSNPHVSTCTDVTFIFFKFLVQNFFLCHWQSLSAIVFSSVSQPPIYLYLHSQDFEIYFFFPRSKLLIFALIKENEFFDLKVHEIPMCVLGKIYFLRRYCQTEIRKCSSLFLQPPFI